MPNYVLENSLWKYHNGKPTIILIGRNAETKEIKTFGIQNFKPYFYKADPNGKELNCYGEPITKVVWNTPTQCNEQVRAFSDQGIKTFNSDIPYDVQYLIDKKIYYGFNEKLEPVEVPLLLPRICYYDIEVNIPLEEGIDKEKSKHPIPVITVMDSYTENIVVFTMGGRVVDKDQVNFSTEKELLEAFANYVSEKNFDIITGWNSAEFDNPYVFGRSCVNGASLRGISRISDIYPTDKYFTGRSNIDMMVFFKDWSKPMGSQPSYGLKYIAKTHCGFAYDEYGAVIQTLIANDEWEKIVEYAKNDVIALRKIDLKFGLLQYHENMRRIVGIKYEDTIRRTVIVETLLLRQGIKPIPKRKKHEAIDYDGALVIQPSIGIKTNVGVYDLKSLYPSIILAKNLSPDIDKMIPKAIIHLSNEREKLRALRMAGKADEVMETSETSLKYATNAFYGYLGSPYARLYAPEIAREITETGQAIDKAVHKVIRDEGKIVEYSDTDSSFAHPINSLEEGKAIESKINAFLKDWAKQNKVPDALAPIIKLEKIYSRVFFKKRSSGSDAAKKKYVGHLIWKDGHEKDELSYTGIEIKRSDTAPITKTLMESFFKKILIENDPESAMREIVEIKKKILKGKISVHEVAIPKATKSNGMQTAWTKGRDNGSKYLGIRFNASSKPKLLYCISPAKEICIDENINDAEVKSKITIDWSKQCDRVLASKFQSLVESIGYKWDNVSTGQITIDDLINQFC